MKSSDKKFKLLSFETLGIVFVLISIIGLLCLFAGKYLFGEVGEVVKGFVLGVFGYLSYVVLILTSIYGVIAIAGVKIKIKIPTKFAILGAIGIYALI
ncbi:MAG: hypothetical protein J6C97_01690, partial [Clostridia bacterium]|nr:hypothetical protein [Clostridia bacterium]